MILNVGKNHQKLWIHYTLVSIKKKLNFWLRINILKFSIKPWYFKNCCTSLSWIRVYNYNPVFHISWSLVNTGVLSDSFSLFHFSNLKNNSKYFVLIHFFLLFKSGAQKEIKGGCNKTDPGGTWSDQSHLPCERRLLDGERRKLKRNPPWPALSLWPESEADTDHDSILPIYHSREISTARPAGSGCIL